MRYNLPKNARIKNSRFRGVTTFDKTPGGDHYWVVEKRVKQRWAPGEKIWGDDGKYIDDDAKIEGCSSHFSNVRSVRAFRRRLKEWSKYLPSGIEFILSSRFVGADVYGKTRKP